MRTISALALLAASLLLGRHGTAAAASSPSMPPQSSCLTAIILFSPCIAYLDNDMDANVTPLCCSSYSSVFASSSGFCLCYLLQEPPMLGFPLNETRLFSLSSDCSSINATIANRGSLQALCSASPSPPLPLLSGYSPLPAAPVSSPASSSSPNASPGLGSSSPDASPELSDSSPDASPEPSDDYEAAPNFAPEPNASDYDYPESSSATPQKNGIGTSRLSAGSVYTILLVTYRLLQ